MENENKNLFVIKSTGEREPFDESKLLNSLRHTGATDAEIQKVLNQVESEMKDGMTTKKIYSRVHSILKRVRRPAASQYSLRRAVRDLGPSGFPFEKYIGDIMKTQGYEVAVDVIMQGWCVDHEIDVSARKDGKHIIVECKFHNEEGYKTDLKVALYVYQRFLDIQKRHDSLKDEKERVHEGWLVTNTKLTSKAIQYAECAGLTVIGWNYPKQGSLEDMIRSAKLCPVTVLTTISSSDKRRLMEGGVVLCRDLVERRGELHALGLPEAKITKVLKEVAALHHE